MRKLTESKELIPKDKFIGVWTDDFSMALCLSYFLMLNNYKEENLEHLRFLFHLWWYHGLGNGDRDEPIGLGRNVKQSFNEFVHYEKRAIELGGKKKLSS